MRLPGPDATAEVPARQVSTLMTAEPANQWPAQVLHLGFNETVRWETERRTLINISMSGMRLATRPEAVRRDIVRNFIAACAPAGNA